MTELASSAEVAQFVFDDSADTIPIIRCHVVGLEECTIPLLIDSCTSITHEYEQRREEDTGALYEQLKISCNGECEQVGVFFLQSTILKFTVPFPDSESAEEYRKLVQFAGMWWLQIRINNEEVSASFMVEQGGMIRGRHLLTPEGNIRIFNKAAELQ